MICISCWSHGNRLDFIVAFLWSSQALIHFAFTLLAKHIMWIWSFVPDSPRLTSLSPQAPDASQRSRGGGEEFHWIQKTSPGFFWLFRLPCLPPLLMLTCSSWSPAKPSSWPWGTVDVHTHAHYMGAWRVSGFHSRQVPIVGSSPCPGLWYSEWGELSLTWFISLFIRAYTFVDRAVDKLQPGVYPYRFHWEIHCKQFDIILRLVKRVGHYI